MLSMTAHNDGEPFPQNVKWSIFNRLYNVPDIGIALYNYASDRVVLITEELWSILSVNKLQISQIRVRHEELYSQLSKNEMIVNQEDDEYAKMKRRISGKLSSTDTLKITINPTLDCNCRCWYCYEKHDANAYMSAETASRIIKFIRKQLSLGFHRVSLSLFGGEPLLEAKTLAVPLTKNIKSLCDECKTPLSVHITTNAILLSPDILDELTQLNVPISLQIPFDGNREWHNRTKRTSSGEPYDMALRNIGCALQRSIEVNVRCNYTDENIDTFYELIDDIDRLSIQDKRMLSLSFQRVWQVQANEKLLEKVDAISSYAQVHGFGCTYENAVCSDTLCYADYLHSYVLNYNGDVFKCTARDFSHSRRTGAIAADGSFELADKDLQLQRGFVKACERCTLLPICTICSQAFKESSTVNCPREISEENKEGQIMRRFIHLFGNYLGNRKIEIIR